MEQLRNAVVVLCLLCLSGSMIVAGQDSVPKQTVSSEALTTDQIAIYRTVLEDFRKNDESQLKLANETEPQDVSRFSSQQCMEGIKPEPASSVVHRIADSALLGPQIALVNRAEQQEQVDKNDPQNGLFTLSEIAFDKTHRYAVVTYSFVCGNLCGSGKTVVLTRTGQKWKVRKTCGGWIS